MKVGAIEMSNKTAVCTIGKWFYWCLTRYPLLRYLSTIIYKMNYPENGGILTSIVCFQTLEWFPTSSTPGATTRKSAFIAQGGAFTFTRSADSFEPYLSAVDL